MANRAGMFTPLDSSGNGMSAADARYALGAIVGSTPRCVLGGGFTQSSSNMQFNQLPSVFVLADLDNTGAVSLTPFDTFSFTIPAGPSSGSRIDSVIVRQQIPGGSLNETSPYGVISTVQGTASTGTPSPPSIPSGWYEYARITVPTNASTASACSYQVLYPAQPALPPLSAASLAALQLNAGQYTGQRAYVGAAEYRWDGTGWYPWVADEVSYGLQGGFATNNTGIHSTKNGRIVTYAFNLLSPNSAIGNGGAVFYWNDSNWAPAVSVDFMCEVRNNGGGVIGWAAVYHSTDGNLYFSQYIAAGGTVSSSLPANSLLIGSNSYRAAH